MSIINRQFYWPICNTDTLNEICFSFKITRFSQSIFNSRIHSSVIEKFLKIYQLLDQPIKYFDSLHRPSFYILHLNMKDRIKNVTAYQTPSSIMHKKHLHNTGRGLIRPQIGPSNFFRRIALRTIQIDRFHQDKHFGAIFIHFNNIFSYSFNPSLYSIFLPFSPYLPFRPQINTCVYKRFVSAQVTLNCRQSTSLPKHIDFVNI